MMLDKKNAAQFLAYGSCIFTFYLIVIIIISGNFKSLAQHHILINNRAGSQLRDLLPEHLRAVGLKSQDQQYQHHWKWEFFSPPPRPSESECPLGILMHAQV